MENTQLRLLIDHELIRTTLYHFAESLDNRDWSLLRSICRDHVYADFTAWGIEAQQLPTAAFVDTYKASFWRPEMRTQHLYTNFRIQVAGDKAEVVFNFLGQHYTPDFVHGEEFFLRGEYADTLEREGDSWKISAVKLRVFYTTGAIQMLASAS